MASRPPENAPIGRDPAKARFYFIAFHRLLGAVLVAVGLLVLQRVIAWPETLGWALVGLGLFDVFAMPLLLARLWRTPR